MANEQPIPIAAWLNPEYESCRMTISPTIATPGSAIIQRNHAGNELILLRTSSLVLLNYFESVLSGPRTSGHVAAISDIYASYSSSSEDEPRCCALKTKNPSK